MTTTGSPRTVSMVTDRSVIAKVPKITARATAPISSAAIVRTGTPITSPPSTRPARGRVVSPTASAKPPYQIIRISSTLLNADSTFNTIARIKALNATMTSTVIGTRIAFAAAKDSTTAPEIMMI